MERCALPAQSIDVHPCRTVRFLMQFLRHTPGTVLVMRDASSHPSGHCDQAYSCHSRMRLGLPAFAHASRTQACVVTRNLSARGNAFLLARARLRTLYANHAHRCCSCWLLTFNVSAEAKNASLRYQPDSLLEWGISSAMACLCKRKKKASLSNGWRGEHINVFRVKRFS